MYSTLISGVVPTGIETGIDTVSAGIDTVPTEIDTVPTIKVKINV